VDQSTNLLKKGQGNVLLEPDLKLLLEYFHRLVHVQQEVVRVSLS